MLIYRCFEPLQNVCVYVSMLLCFNWVGCHIFYRGRVQNIKQTSDNVSAYNMLHLILKINMSVGDEGRDPWTRSPIWIRLYKHPLIKNNSRVYIHLLKKIVLVIWKRNLKIQCMSILSNINITSLFGILIAFELN